MQYRPYAELRDVPHVVVDGSAQPGTVLTLSHWPGSATPDVLRADLSAEIAFRYLDRPDQQVDVEFVTNNHFDQDGLVSVFALTRPDEARPRRDRLIDIARAGDFSRFHDRAAARAAIAIANLDGPEGEDPYPEVLARVPELVDHVDRFRDLWAEEDAHVTATEQAIADGTITITEQPELDLAIVDVPASWHARAHHRFTMTDAGAAHPYAVYNATDRFVVVTVGAGPPELRYRYETWVHYVSRRPRPRVDLTPLAAELRHDETGPGRWTFDGVDSLSPALHLVGSDSTSIDADEFVARVTDTLRAARATWSPYPD
ncbi:MAG: DUF6687 family protein [Acidimicrobiia bacterium]